MSTAHEDTITVRWYMNKVTSLFFDQAVLQIVDVTLRDLRYVVLHLLTIPWDDMNACRLFILRLASVKVIYQNYQYINA